MSSAITADEVKVPSGGTKNYLNAESGILSWLTTVDHKRIGLMYLGSVLTAFLVAGLFALVVRLELLNPHSLLGEDGEFFLNKKAFSHPLAAKGWGSNNEGR